MKTIKMHERRFYDHYIMATLKGKTVLTERRSTWNAALTRLKYLMSYFADLNEMTKEPQFDLYLARERGYGAWDIKRIRYIGGEWIPEDAQVLPEMLANMASMAKYSIACH